MSQPLLAVDDLRVHLFTARGVVRAVDGVGFSLEAGRPRHRRRIGLRQDDDRAFADAADPGPPARIVSGRIMFDGEDVVAMDEARLRALRGNAMAMIYQDPMTTLNPVFSVGEQIAEAVRLHRDASRAAALARAVEMLELVGHSRSGPLRARIRISFPAACVSAR